ncbi:MAG: LysM peptidoglycan-binding domain-containing protein [Paracoccaceae bacterium]
MIRLVLGYFVLILVLCGIVVYSPWERVQGDPVPVDTFADAPVPLEPSAAAQLGLVDAVPEADGLRVEAGGDLGATSDAVLTALGMEVPDADPAVPAGSSQNALAAMVAQALREGQSDADIDALVNQAAGQGAITVPAMLVTAEGRVDTAVLLATIVARSHGAEHGEGDASSQADVVLTPEAAAIAAGSDVTYTVQIGDSLGSLALRFYGDSALHPVIYDANRGLMASPDSLAVGQVLIIPGRS